MEGISTSVAASRLLTLRVGGQEGSMGQKGSLWGLKGEKSQAGSTTQPEGRGLSTVELGDGGVKVRLFVKISRYSAPWSTMMWQVCNFRVLPRYRKRVRENKYFEQYSSHRDYFFSSSYSRHQGLHEPRYRWNSCCYYIFSCHMVRAINMLVRPQQPQALPAYGPSHTFRRRRPCGAR